MNKPRILIADDEPDLLHLAVEMFTAEGLQVAGASSGKEALSIFQNQPIDAVLSDAHMPDLSGPDLLKELSKHPKKTPLFYLWTGDEAIQEKEWVAKGGSGVFFKPCSLSGITKRILKDLRKAS